MKTIITLFSVFVLSFSGMIAEPTTISNESDTVQDQLIFDGYEGGYYFFTDQSQEAVVLENKNEDLDIDLINGNLEGKTFKVAYKVIERTSTSSSEGIIEDVDLIK